MGALPWVLVTGASTGIGRATVARLCRAGFRVGATVRREQDAASLVAELGELVLPLRLDVTDTRSLERAAADLEGLAPEGLTGLVNNAGIAFGGPLECVPLEEVRRQLEVNVVGLLAVTQAFLPLVRRARGRIVNVGSMSGRVATPLFGPYCASKFAVEALSDSLRQELAPWGIAVVLLQPGAVESAIWEKGRQVATRLLGSLEPRHLELYGAQARDVERLLRFQEGHAAPADSVARAVERVLTCKRPPTRLPVGKDALLLGLLRAALGDRMLDRVLARMMRRAAR